MNRPIQLFFVLIFVLMGSATALASAVISNQYDDRQFEYLELDNGLKVLLIFDPAATKAAASLDVGVGSAHDPEHRQGLAHFVEHMLFMGSESYPVAGDFERFVGLHGGQANAYTAISHTNFHFDINARELEGALDRFANFFVAPRFDIEQVDAESNAIHAEFLARFSSPERRKRDVLSSVAAGLSPARFGSGNIDSLLGELPLDAEETHVDALRGAAEAFFVEHYGAADMRLVVSSPYSLEDLKKYVVPRFRLLPPGHPKPFFKLQNQSLSELLKHRIDIQTEPGVHNLSLIFPIDGASAFSREKPLEYLASLIAQENEDGLQHALERMGLARAVSARHTETFDGGDAFVVDVNMTAVGYSQLPVVRQLVFGYLTLIRERGIEKWRYLELVNQGEVAFSTARKPEPLKAVSTLSSRLTRVALEQLLRSQYSFEFYDERLISSVAKQLVEENSLTVVEHPYVDLFDGREHSQYYHAAYTVTPDSGALELDSAQVALVKKYRQSLRLPGSNAYLADSLALVKHKESEKAWQVPKLIREKNSVKTWFFPDVKFKQPKTYIEARWVLPKADASPESSAAMSLLVAIMDAEVRQKLSAAEQAGFEFSVERSERGIRLSLSGYSQHMRKTAKKLMSVVSDVMSDGRERWSLSHRHLDVARSSFPQFGSPVKNTESYVQAYRELPSILFNPRWSAEEVSTIARNIDRYDFLRLSNSLFDGSSVDMLIYGNETQRSASKLAKIWERAQRRQGSAPELAPALVVDISKERDLYVKPFGQSAGDTTVMLYVQGKDDSLQERVKFKVLNQMVRAPFYHYLRTEKQLGYIVHSAEYNAKNVPGFIGLVQAPNASAVDIYSAMNLFFAQQGAEMFATFEQSRKAVLSELLQQPSSPREEVDGFWQSIMHGDFQFDERVKMQEIVEALSPYKMKRFYVSRLMHGAGRVILVSSGQEFDAHVFSKNARLITDARSFKNSMPVYLYP